MSDYTDLPPWPNRTDYHDSDRQWMRFHFREACAYRARMEALVKELHRVRDEHCHDMSGHETYRIDELLAACEREDGR